VLVLFPLVVGLAIGIATGGKLGNLAHVRFRWPWFVLAVLVIREAILFRPFNGIDGIQYLYVAALAGLVGWTFLHVRTLNGVWLVAAGAALNLLVVVANGGRMPVAPALAGVLVQRNHLGQYVLMGSNTNLNWLADWITVSGPVGIRGAYSPGDLVVAAGIGVVAYFATRQRTPPTTKLVETSSRIGDNPP
jgi:Family of unknown function (DUF5317)